MDHAKSTVAVCAIALALCSHGETFTFPAEGRTAISYADRLAVTPLAEGATNFTCEVQARPVRLENGIVTNVAKRPFVGFFPERVVNVSGRAHVTVSSRDAKSTGFRPLPRLNEPAALTDGEARNSRNFRFAPRKAAPTRDNPEWVVLDFADSVPLAGVLALAGDDEPFPSGKDVIVQSYVGTGDPRIDASASSWRDLAGEWSPDPDRYGSLFRSWRLWKAAKTVTARAFRLLFAGPGLALHGRPVGNPRLEPTPALAEIALLSPADGKQAKAIDVDVTSGVPIRFAMPFDGRATIQIRDANGVVVANPVTDLPFAAGRAKAHWDLTDIEGKTVLAPGEYTWSGVAIPPLTLDYLYSYYPVGLPDDRRAWLTADMTGGWLADHDPPRGVVRDGDTMWLNAWAEAGHSIIHVDGNMKKLWGTDRIWLAVPQEICADGGFCYGYSQGGWCGSIDKIVMVDPKRGYASKTVMLLKHESKAENNWWSTTITGFQVIGEKAFVSRGDENAIRVYDISKGQAAKTRNFGWDVVNRQFDELVPNEIASIRLPNPGRIRKRIDGRLAALSGPAVVTIDPASFCVTTNFVTDIETPLGLDVAPDGTHWIGAGEPRHQVIGYSESGKVVATLGKRGRRRIGAWDADDLEEPAGVAMDAQGRIWVAEHTHWEKRVSVWDVAAGRVVKDMIGPTQYGGDGAIDPEDENRLFYRGLELRRNPATGDIRPVSLIYRPDAPELPPFSEGDYPSYAFRARGELWFTSYQPPHGHPTCVLWKLDGDRVRAVAAVGAVTEGKKSVTNAIPFLKPQKGMLFAWTDMNGDGKIGQDEVKTRIALSDGKPIAGIAPGWNWRMNGNFMCAAVTDLYKEGKLVVFRPIGFTEKGYPIYDVPATAVPGVLCGQGLMPDSRGNVIALGDSVVSMKPDGKVRWRYRNEWPGLHAGHRTTAAGDEPGVLIAPTRIWGMVKTAGDAGEVVAFNSNLGCSYLMTADDGLYLGRIFRDQRVAATVWNMNVPPDSATLSETSLYDEHFGGTFERIRGDDGRFHYRYVVGKTHCSVVELKGLDGVKRLAGGRIRVTASDIGRAVAHQAAASARTLVPKVYNIVKGRPDEKTPDIDGFALGVDAVNLYVRVKWQDDRAPFANGGSNPFELFKSGDTVEVMLRTKAKKSDSGVRKGDVRLLFAPYGGKTVAVLYDYLAPDASPSEKVGFSSPWRTLTVNRVSILNTAKVEVKRNGASLVLEAQIPLKTLHFKPDGDTKGDVGYVQSDATGQRAARRVYWSNKNTAIMSDLPTEAGIEPDLWGTFRFPKLDGSW